MAELEKAAIEMGVEASKAEDYAYSFIFVHLPKGEKPKKAAKKRVAVTTSKKKAETPKPALKSVYSWKNKIPVADLQPIVMHCQHYSKKIESPTLISIKGTGPGSVQVEAQTGEYLIFDDQGYPVFIMNPTSFARKCNEGTTVAQQEFLKHQEKENAELKVKVQN